MILSGGTDCEAKGNECDRLSAWHTGAFGLRRVSDIAPDAAPTGLELASRLRAAARQRGVTLWRFLGPLTRNPTSFIATLETAKKPKPLTVLRILALIAGESLPEAQRQIKICVPESLWRQLDKEAQKLGSRIGKVAAEWLQYIADESE